MTRRSSQFDLRTLAILLFCFSVGLAASVGTAIDRPGFLEFVESLPGTLYDVLLITGATALAIGLVQQCVFLKRASIENSVNPTSIRYAIVWRVVVALVLMMLLAVKVGMNRKLIELPANESLKLYFYSRLLPEYLIHICVMIALAERIGQYRRDNSPRNGVKQIVFWTAAILAGLFVLAHVALTTSYVYTALSNIEAAEPTMFHRHGAYPDFQAEGHWLFWMASAATAFSICGSAMLLSLFSSLHMRRTRQISKCTIGILLLSASAGFGYWYLLVGFARISPDFAEAGMASDPWDWVEAAMLLAIILPAIAYRITADWSKAVDIHCSNRRSPIVGQFMLASMVLGLAAVYHCLTLVQNILFDDTPILNATAMTRLYWLCTDINIYVPIAISLLSVQLFWKQWQNQPPEHRIRVAPVSLRKFLFALAALTVMIVTTLPTLAAFCLSYWLSPWS